MKVELCNDLGVWDVYVHASGEASNYHQSAWKRVIEETYGHPTYYLAAFEGERICGILPLVGMKSRVFGHFVVSLPFFNYGGLVADSSEAKCALLEHAAIVAREVGARHIELRQGGASDMEWQSTAAKVAMIVPLPRSVEELRAGLSSRLRNKVKNALKNDLVARWGGIELVDSFYSVFAANMHHLGTPVYPRAWFENILKTGAGDSRILTLWNGDRPVAATLITSFRDMVELPWIASLPEERKTNSTVLLYWAALEWALSAGFRSVDLGRCTPGGGVYQFKRQWNCNEIPLHWYYWLAPGQPIPHLRPDNPKFRAAIWIWQRLPLDFANWLGPKIVRSIP
jgi:FemAB-related protein (PEP-CTERM system-associated)